MDEKPPFRNKFARSTGLFVVSSAVVIVAVTWLGGGIQIEHGPDGTKVTIGFPNQAQAVAVEPTTSTSNITHTAP